MYLEMGKKDKFVKKFKIFTINILWKFLEKRMKLALKVIWVCRMSTIRLVMKNSLSKIKLEIDLIINI